MPLLILVALVVLAVYFVLAWAVGLLVQAFLPKRVGPPWRTRAKWGTTGIVMLVFLFPLLRGLAMWATGQA